jgi:hypothetical protein
MNYLLSIIYCQLIVFFYLLQYNFLHCYFSYLNMSMNFFYRDKSQDNKVKINLVSFFFSLSSLR